MRLMGAGDEAWRRGDVPAALQFMRQAHALHAPPEVACRYATLMHYAGQTEEARGLLLRTIAAVPWYLPAQTQLARMVRIDRRAASAEARAENAARRELLAAMRRALDRDPFFKPSDFWESIASKHERMLDDFGIDHFKRSVAHNYQNWLIVDPADSQWQRLRELWLKEGYVEPVLNTLEAVDDAGLIWDVDQPAYVLASPPSMAVYKLATGILWEAALAGDKAGFLAGFEESTIGNPIRLRRNGRLISQDAAHSARELNALFERAAMPKTGQWTFAELGAGHGRLAEMIGTATDHRYWIFDIAPTLAVSQWYIQQRFPDEKIFAFRDFEHWEDIEHELRDCRFAFFTANQMRLMPANSVDVFVNICSLMEMRRDQIDYFLERIAEVTRRVFMSKQWYEWENATDRIRVVKDDFRIRQGFELISDQPDDIYKELFLQIWRRQSPSV